MGFVGGKGDAYGGLPESMPSSVAHAGTPAQQAFAMSRGEVPVYISAPFHRTCRTLSHTAPATSGQLCCKAEAESQVPTLLSIAQGLYHLQNAVHEACVSKVVQPSQTRYKAIIAGDTSEFTLQLLMSIQPLAWELAPLTCV